MDLISFEYWFTIVRNAYVSLSTSHIICLPTIKYNLNINFNNFNYLIIVEYFLEIHKAYVVKNIKLKYIYKVKSLIRQYSEGCIEFGCVCHFFLSLPK